MISSPTRVARYYDTARTAHVERLRVMTPGDLLYRRTRADWDPDLAAARPEVQHVSILTVVTRILCGRYDSIEIPEPLAVSLLPHTLVCSVAAQARNALFGRKVSLVTYAIENLDPVAKIHDRTRMPSGAVAVVLRSALRVMLRPVDRIAFGTDSARSALRAALGERSYRRLKHGTEITTVDALPSPTGTPVRKQADSVCFLGTFEDRKGIRELMKAWPLVKQLAPNARLTLLGKGDLLGEVIAFSQPDSSVELHLDPSRDLIRFTLQKSVCLVMMSKRTPTWREQVGLPIVEALEYGVEIITSTETGIAGWLSKNGHHVLDPSSHSALLADTIVEVLTSPRSPDRILGDLPVEDGRMSADRWLFR